MSEYQIFVLSKEHFNGFVYEGPDGGTPIYLYSHDNHYDVITSMSGFLNRVYYCQKCRKGYDHKEQHGCNDPCKTCHHLHDDRRDDPKICNVCNRKFINETCFKLHKKLSRSKQSTCKQYRKCEKCKVTINLKRHSRTHRCGEKYCQLCKDFFMPDHRCYLKPVEADARKSAMHQIYIFFAFQYVIDESNQCIKGFRADENNICTNCKKRTCRAASYRPNLCVVQKICTRCLDKYEIDDESKCNVCDSNQLVFDGENTSETFCKWLFHRRNYGATVICHNFKGYDSYPILKYLHNNAILPKVVTSGAKYTSIKVKECRIRFIDSRNFLPMTLQEMSESFNEKKLVDGYFPYLFNLKKNQSVTLQSLPDVSYYNPDDMKQNARDKFMTWYEKHRGDSFDFQSELLRHCKSDVDLLRRCCMKFRSLFIDISKKKTLAGIDPFEKCTTIASACHLLYRANFLKPDTIAIIPSHGYRPEENQSMIAFQWLSFIAHKRNIQIQHGRNVGEKEIGPYKVDGYYRNENGKEVALEFHGDFWHGCNKCYAPSTRNPVLDCTMGEMYQRTLDKKSYIESLGIIYEEMWECEFKRQIKENSELSEFIKSLDIVAPLAPKEAFFGGRTECFKRLETASCDREIKYYDITSLYPYINKTGKVPLGHPNVITERFDSIDKYEGLMKCKVLPPARLFIPVLPFRANDKLVFTLCRTCSETNQQTECMHSDSERALTSTWVTDEIKVALKNGYQLLKVYEVWHFDKISQYEPDTKNKGVFTKYINTFLKLKQEASGWPSHCKTYKDKIQYIQSYYQKEGVRLEYKKIEKNPGLRALAKLMLNSFWGKFGQKSNLTQSSYVLEQNEFVNTLTAGLQDVKNVRHINEEALQLDWAYDDNFIVSSSQSNVVIAAYTTAQARLKLYETLVRLDKRAIYCDTDSVVFLTSPGLWQPPLGDFLGEFKDEAADNSITSFVATGPKSYAYELAKSDKDGNSSICKFRGVNLNSKNALQINFQTLRDLVVGNSSEMLTVTDPHAMKRLPGTGQLLSIAQTKSFQPSFDKRVVVEEVNTVPHGYKSLI
ncbi:uncharacterized protein LOC128548112 [Mercenaria mercenaria]|uniref:uncharacterized protein LOC128548112 n=1 Tax=Mercenaria mercenaria TaxID=6596 RepID=UPI00234F743A|nr:uncharacterized protein LOC128548112 [Mercenaria mercenaria]